MFVIVKNIYEKVVHLFKPRKPNSLLIINFMPRLTDIHIIFNNLFSSQGLFFLLLNPVSLKCFCYCIPISISLLAKGQKFYIGCPNFTFFLLLFCSSALLLRSFIHLFHALSFPSSPAPRHLSSPTPPHYTETDRPILAPTHRMENTHTSCTHTHTHSGCAHEYTDASHIAYTIRAEKTPAVQYHNNPTHTRGPLHHLQDLL